MADDFLLTNFTDVRRELKKLAATAPAAVKAVAIELAQEAVAQGKFKGFVPRDTGNLVSTLRVETDDDKVVFISGGIEGKPSRKNKGPKFVDYAFYVNNGTSKRPPTFFMESSLSLAVIKADSIWRSSLTSWLNRSKF